MSFPLFDCLFTKPELNRKARKDHQEPTQTPKVVAHVRFGPSTGHTDQVRVYRDVLSTLRLSFHKAGVKQPAADRKARKDPQEPTQTPKVVEHVRFGPSTGHTPAADRKARKDHQ